MRLPAFLPTPAMAAAKALNALLARESWAQARLARHAGKTLRLELGRWALPLSVLSDGQVGVAAGEIVPDVVLFVPAARLADLPPVLASRDPARLSELMHIQGEAALAQLVSELARDLRWDAEDALAERVGDVAARRLVGHGQAVAAGLRQSLERLAGNGAEFLAHESGLLASRPAFEAWRADLDALRARLDGLERRLAPAAPAAPSACRPL